MSPALTDHQRAEFWAVMEELTQEQRRAIAPLVGRLDELEAGVRARMFGGDEDDEIGRVHIREAASQLGVTATWLRTLESQGRIPPAKRDANGRVYTQDDIRLLKQMGIGERGYRLKPIATDESPMVRTGRRVAAENADALRRLADK